MTPTVDGRRVRLNNVFNLRDLGGHATRDGGVVRTGMVFRADGLNRLDEADIEVVRPLGLRTVIDLRTDHERTDHGIAPHEALGSSIVHLPVIDVLWASEGADEAHPVDYLVARYLEMTEGVGAVALAGVRPAAGHGRARGVPCGLPLLGRQGPHRRHRRGAAVDPRRARRRDRRSTTTTRPTR